MAFKIRNEVKIKGGLSFELLSLHTFFFFNYQYNFE